jgi:hypothetical protein
VIAFHLHLFQWTIGQSLLSSHLIYRTLTISVLFLSISTRSSSIDSHDDITSYLINRLTKPTTPHFLQEREPFHFVKARSSVSITQTYRQIVRDFENLTPENFSVIEVSRKYEIPHRRAYDLFNFLNAAGVCSSVERGALRWIGAAEIFRTLKEGYAQLEILDLTQNFRVLFHVGPSPTLGILGSRFVCLFLYLGVEILSMKRAVRLFKNPKTEVRSLERRMCVALNFLEALGVVEHTAKTSEYRLTIDRTEIVEYAMEQKKQFSGRARGNAIESLLNRYDSTFLSQMYTSREAAYAGMTL